MKEEIKISERQRKCLEVLADSEYDGEPAVLFFDEISKQTSLPKNQVRVSVRALARKGLVELTRGLIKEEDLGYYGSGYRATQKGLLMVKACKECSYKIFSFNRIPRRSYTSDVPGNRNGGKNYNLCAKEVYIHKSRKRSNAGK